MYARCSSHKSCCNNDSTKTGLSSHFANGCPVDTCRNKGSLAVTMLVYMDVTVEEVELARHGGVKLGTYCFPGGSN